MTNEVFDFSQHCREIHYDNRVSLVGFGRLLGILIEPESNEGVRSFILDDKFNPGESKLVDEFIIRNIIINPEVVSKEVLESVFYKGLLALTD